MKANITLTEVDILAAAQAYVSTSGYDVKDSKLIVTTVDTGVPGSGCGRYVVTIEVEVMPKASPQFP